jgi:predicted secreted protein
MGRERDIGPESARAMWELRVGSEGEKDLHRTYLRGFAGAWVETS